MSNTYPLGTPECIAYAYGEAYAATYGNADPTPLSEEWADGPLPQDIIRAVYREIFGPSWDTYTDDPEARDGDQFILDAWEEGYNA